MSEFGLRTPELLVQQMKEAENQQADRFNDETLSGMLFHAGFLDSTPYETELDALKLFELEQAFLEDKRNKNMGERFDLAINKYLGKIHVVELGKTTDPSSDGQIDGLKQQYNDLLRWMSANGFEAKELERSRSGRWVTEHLPVNEEARPHVVVLRRNRPLISTRKIHNGQTIQIDIVKQMIFSLPHTTRAMVLKQSGAASLAEEPAIKWLEDNQLKYSSGGIESIRTVYYLATEIVE